MVRLATACVLFTAISFAFANAYAQENLTNLEPLRLEFSFSQIGADAKQADNNISTKSSDRFGMLTYYFKRQFFGEIGYGRPRTHEVSINSQIIPSLSDEKTALALYGFGFRSYRKASNGEYLGIGVRFSSDLSNGSESDSTQTIRLFTQKDTRKRYGVLQLSRENGEAGEISKLGGRHVWFNNDGVGFGFQWALGIGREINETGLETNYRSRDAGILLMYRPTLIDSGFIQEPLDESTENSLDESVDYIDASEDPICDLLEDPLCESDENPFGESDENPFGESDENPFGESDENPFGESDENPFGESDENPFSESTDGPVSESDENPFTESGDDPFCDPTKDPLCEPSDESVAE
ncbi:MSCRAMM family adhesin SdrC [Granulosicoccus sp.]|nr:hypothetical protein [Granulosicoccus sp.]MDB4222741.1 MSCRAMM family adhesin SdrC [Granulosicoccus sp.]